jgi:hypothetical protein
MLILLEHLLTFSPKARLSTKDALELPLFENIRVPTREILAGQSICLGFEDEPFLDEAVLRRYFREEAQKYPIQDIVIILHVLARQHGAMRLVCRDIAGEDMATLELSESGQHTIVAEIRQQLALRLGVPGQWLKLVLPCGQLLGNTDEASDIGSLLGTDAQDTECYQAHCHKGWGELATVGA